MGEIFLDREAPDRAETAFNTAVKLNPLDPAALSGYARAMTMKQRNLKIALTFAEKSVALAPENKVFQERLKRVQQALDGNEAEDQSQKLA
jgi:tetratricopeptide (TPR) repeat protein